MSNKKEAFFKVCPGATEVGPQPGTGFFVALYKATEFFGGEEEGGWVDHKFECVAYKEYATQEEAVEAARQIEIVSFDLDMAEKLGFESHCEAQCKWLESRGLEPNYLPEVDGEISYELFVESCVNSNATV